MEFHNRDALKANPGAEGRFQLTGREVFEIHLFDEDAAEEQALCGTNTHDTERMGARGYLEDRLYDNWIGTVCQDCKVRAVSFTVSIIDGLEAYERVEEAENYRRLAATLSRETET